MTGKSKKRLKKRAAATYRKSAQKVIDDLKPWMVLTPHALAMMHAQDMIEKTFGKRPPASDIAVRVAPKLCPDGKALVVNVDKIRKQANVDKGDTYIFEPDSVGFSLPPRRWNRQ